MSLYRIEFADSSKKEFDKLDNLTRQRIAKKLHYFLEQDDPLIYARQLIHTSIGSYSFRVGHYRIFFDIDGNMIQILGVRHRKDSYKKTR